MPLRIAGMPEETVFASSSRGSSGSNSQINVPITVSFSDKKTFKNRIDVLDLKVDFHLDDADGGMLDNLPGNLLFNHESFSRRTDIALNHQSQWNHKEEDKSSQTQNIIVERSAFSL